MKYIILGRTGSGKTKLADTLAANGLMLSKSSTTRKPRSEEDRKHYHFLTREEAAAIPESEKLLPTVLNGELYFSSKHMLEQADVIILDPKGMKEICGLYPDVSFRAVYIKADKDTAEEHAISRSSNPDAERSVFLNRYESENRQFSEFEEQLKNRDYTTWPSNLSAAHVYTNTFEESCLQEITQSLLQYRRQHANLMKIVDQCADLGVVRSDVPGKIDLWMEADATHEHPYKVQLAHDLFTDRLMGDDTGLAMTIRAWCSYGINLNLPDEITPVEQPEN